MINGTVIEKEPVNLYEEKTDISTQSNGFSIIKELMNDNVRSDQWQEYSDYTDWIDKW